MVVEDVMVTKMYDADHPDTFHDYKTKLKMAFQTNMSRDILGTSLGSNKRLEYKKSKKTPNVSNKKTKVDSQAKCSKCKKMFNNTLQQ